MKEPKFLFSTGVNDGMEFERFACQCSPYEYVSCNYQFLQDLDIEKYRLQYVPVGSVQYVQKFCECMNLSLPESISYYGTEKFTKRNILEGKLKDAQDCEFVKPKKIKQFTGVIKSKLRPLSPETDVWISEPVPFESEYRFYIHDFVSEPKILGWSRYDDTETHNPDPNLDYVKLIAQELHDNIGPSAYSLDIGWRSDIQEFDLVELNDAWALGYYSNSDSQSNPPSKEDYAEMLISRWTQILFCNIV